jgi:hypothetical protein
MCDLLTHLFHGARDFVGDLFDLQVLDQIFDFAGTLSLRAIASLRVTALPITRRFEPHGATKFQVGRRFSAALRAKHGWKDSTPKRRGLFGQVRLNPNGCGSGATMKDVWRRWRCHAMWCRLL